MYMNSVHVYIQIHEIQKVTNSSYVRINGVTGQRSATINIYWKRDAISASGTDVGVSSQLHYVLTMTAISPVYIYIYSHIHAIRCKPTKDIG